MKRKEPYQCDICGSGFRQKRYWQCHMRNHPGNDGLYRCDLCPKTFRNNLSHQKHLRGHRGDFKCNICSRKFSSADKLRYHREHRVCTNSEKKFQCDICSKILSSLKYLKQHQAHYHFRGKKKFCCYLCPMEFSKKSKLHHHQHESNHKQFKSCADDAPNVGKREIVEDGITVRPHSNENLAIRTEFQCAVCLKIFKSKTILKKHVQLHLGVRKKLTCDICQKSYREGNSFYLHKKTHISEASRCNVCSKNFASAQILRKHKCRGPTLEEKLFQCKLCDKAFRSHTSLRHHELIKHTDTPSEIFCCDLCEMEFPAKRDLRNHQPIHAKYKQLGLHLTYACGSETAEEHDRANDGGSVFKCHHCEKTFSNNLEALQHYTHIHTPTNVEKEFFWCDICEEKFSTKKDIRRHIKKHDKIFQWHTCKKRFECKHSFKYHLRFHIRDTQSSNVPPQESVGLHLYNLRSR